jgi:site-specific recombinase XerD
VPTPPPRTVADLIAEVILRGKSAKTRAAYRADLADFLTWLIGRGVSLPVEVADLRRDTPASHAVNATLMRLQQVSEADIHAYMAHLRPSHPAADDGLAPATRNRRLTPLRLLFQRLLRYHLIAINPLEYVRGEKLPNASTTVYLTRQEARRLEASCQGPTLRDQRDLALICFMLTSGVRSSEAIGLQVNDLEQIGNHPVAWVQGKGGARQRVKVKPRTWALLHAYLTAAGITEGPVFRRVYHVGPRTPVDGAVRQYKVAGQLSYIGLYWLLNERFRQADLGAKAADLSPHSLRHSFVTLALKGGASIAQTQAAARHADPATTMRYAHDMDSLDDNAVDYVTY